MGIYVDALKIYNKDGSKWITPRKDTTEYNEVMKIMKTLQSEKPKKEAKAAAKKEPKAAAKKTKAAKTKVIKTEAEIMKPKTDTTARG